MENTGISFCRFLRLSVLAFGVWAVVCSIFSPPISHANLKLVLLSYEVGQGQVSMERALLAELEKNPGVAVERVVFDDLLSDRARGRLIDGHFKSLRWAPWLAGLNYGVFSRVPESVRRYWVRNRVLDSTLERQLVSRLEGVDGVVVFFDVASMAVSELKRTGRLPESLKVVTITPDLGVNPRFDREGFLVVPTLQQELAFGPLRPEGSITRIEGLPPRREFLDDYDPRVLRENLGLDPDIRVILIAGGGEGFGLDQLVEFLPYWKPYLPIQVVVISGRNTAVKASIDEVVARGLDPNLRVKSLGFVGQFHRYLGAADVFVSKPGGSTIAEASAMGKGIFVLESLPGQERENLEVLEKAEAAQRIRLQDLQRVTWLLTRAPELAQGMDRIFPRELARESRRRLGEVVHGYFSRGSCETAVGSP